MSSQLLAECMKQYKLHGLEPEFQSYFTRMKSRLLASRDVARGLVERSTEEDDPSGPAQQVLMLLLDEARMGLENDSEYAGGFLEAVEQAVQTGMESGTIQQMKLLEIAGLYRWIDLPIPQSFKIDLDTTTLAPNMEGFDLSESIQGIARDILENGGSAFDFFKTFDVMLATAEEEAQAVLANHVATEDGPFFERCALFMILSGTELVQMSAITGLLARIDASVLEAETLVLLPMIRGWFAPGPVQVALDNLIKKARRKAIPGQSSVAQPQIQEIIATITDGVGAQGITIRLEHGEDSAVAMILLKTGYGVKDNFLIFPEDDFEARQIVGQRRIESGADDISSDTFRVLVEGALADGVKNGCLPPPDFLDVIETCGLFDLRPQELNFPALFDLADPKQKIRSASAQALGRWITDDEVVEVLEYQMSSWFEDTEATREIIATGRTNRGIKNKLRKYLETRRDIWARRFLQTALMFRDSEQILEWKTLTASAHGLMKGRKLNRIPLMENIMRTTIRADKAKRR